MAGLTNADIDERLKKNGSTLRRVSEYLGMSAPMTVKCDKCGVSRTTRADTCLKKPVCRNCKVSSKARAKKVKELNAKVDARLKEVGSTLRRVTDCEGLRLPLTVKCILCGKERTAQAGYILRCYACASCSSKAFGPARVTAKAQLLNFPKMTGGDNGGYRKRRAFFRCPYCSAQYFAVLDNWVRHPHCRKCGRRICPAGSSFVEIMLYVCLRLRFPEVIWHDRALIGRELDLYLPNEGFALEFGAWYLHKGEVAYDMEKRGLCADKGVRLLTIYEGTPEAGDPQVPEGCWFCAERLAADSPEADGRLRFLIDKVLVALGENPSTPEEWQQAKRDCFKMTLAEKVPSDFYWEDLERARTCA